jgi:hypothetical protein
MMRAKRRLPVMIISNLLLHLIRNKEGKRSMGNLGMELLTEEKEGRPENEKIEQKLAFCCACTCPVDRKEIANKGS